MRAVNLIPAEARRSSGAAGRSGGAAYILLGALAVLVTLAGTYTMVGKKVDDKRADLARVEQQAASAEAHAASLQGYATFAALRASRVQTVKSIADSRFDWAHVMHEVARIVPKNVWLTALTGTVAPGVPVQGSAAAVTLRGAVLAPALELLGCTTSQSHVAQMMTALRQIDGVRRVTLQQSIKTEGSGGSAGGSSGGGSSSDCRAGSATYPQFQVVVFFDPATPIAAPAAAAPAGAASAPTTTTPPSTK